MLQNVFNTLGTYRTCEFIRTATPVTLLFDAFVIVITGVVLWYIWQKDKKVLQRYALAFLGVLLFELFTAPMWNNDSLGRYSYLYRDVSWILTLGWATLITAVRHIVDNRWPHMSAGKKFGAYLVGLSLLTFPFELLLVAIGVRSYSPEVMEAASGFFVGGAPLKALYYVPVFLSLVIGFAKYWELIIDKRPLVPVRKPRFLVKLGLTALAVFLFELMVEPMVVNANLPAWSYVYRDISIIMTGSWVLVIWAVVSVVDKWLYYLNIKLRFAAYVVAAAVLTWPMESWLIVHGYRVYGPSAAANFTGFTMPLAVTPIEVAVAVPLYLGLIIATVRYWEIVVENKL